MNILGLLEDLEWPMIYGESSISAGPMCLSCGADTKPTHRPACELKAAIDALRSGRLRVCEWVKLLDAKPIIPDGWSQSVCVLASWDSENGEALEMMFERRTIRGKTVERFEWQGRISPWVITHWMYLPSAPINK